MVNQVILIGNLGQDPDFRTLDNGTAVCRLSVATNESYKDKSGEWQNLTEWHNVIAWRDLAERIADRLHKGNKVYVAGKIGYRKYQDKDGVERYATDIVANAVRSLEPATNDRDARNFPADVPAKYEINSPGDPMKTGVLVPAPANTAAENGDNLPF